MNAFSKTLERRGPFGAMGLSGSDSASAAQPPRLDIDQGLSGQEFVPFFQPQVDAPSGRLLGLEVLARWRHPRFGILSPRSFLVQAAAIGKLDRIEEQMLDHVQDLLGQWHRRGVLVPKISLNCTADRLSSAPFLERAAALGTLGGRVALEVLETVSFEEAGPDFLRQIRNARKLGFLIEVDDFGAGAASISGAMALKPDTLKIDRTLIRGLHNNRHRRDILRSIQAIAKTLNAGLIAEGVQVVEEATTLIEMGVNSHQGYFHAHPLSGDDAFSWICRRPV